MKKILFIAAHRLDRAPNQRFRFEQYLSFLNKNGFECVVSSLILSAQEDKLFYSRGNYLKKFILGIKLGVRRLRDLFRSNSFDIIFIAREAFITGSVFFEKNLKRSKAKIIFDFDDSIWMDVISSNNLKFSWLKNASKTGKIIEMSDLVFAGNEYLASYAQKFNKNVVIVPTTIDTELYAPNYSIEKKKVVIGWSGSVSTIEHFQYAVPALKRLKERYGDQIEILVIGDGNFRMEALAIEGRPWIKESELKDLVQIDVGIMPLPDNEWTWGKCGLKGLQYMALEIPTIMSPVGVNNEIIKDGVNGFLATNTDDWVSKISKLIDDPNLRVRMGKEGRKTVIQRYSVINQRTVYLNYFNSLLS